MSVQVLSHTLSIPVQHSLHTLTILVQPVIHTLIILVQPVIHTLTILVHHFLHTLTISAQLFTLDFPVYYFLSILTVTLQPLSLQHIYSSLPTASVFLYSHAFPVHVCFILHIQNRCLSDCYNLHIYDNKVSKPYRYKFMYSIIREIWGKKLPRFVAG